MATHQPTQPIEINRQIAGPGDDIIKLILPDYIADIPKKFENRMYFVIFIIKRFYIVPAITFVYSEIHFFLK